jgi:formylglycine-generating enzyme required for sulfatase activity
MTLVRRRLVGLLVVAAIAGAAPIASFALDQKEREFQECSECPVMVGIPAGTFTMGSPPSESGRFDSEGPQHTVSIKAFALGKFDVTSEQFLAFLKETGHQPAACNAMLDMRWHSPGHGLASPPFDADLPRWPAVCLDWRDAEPYIDWLNAKVRAEHPATAREHGPYRLPSEAEWEYAARAGTITAPGGATPSAPTTPIATAAAVRGTIASWPTSIASGQILSVFFTACSAMPGNGPPIAGTKAMSARRRTAARGASPIAASA